jgi:hypothetical protein
MVAAEWTTDDQKEWLTAQLPAYAKCTSRASFSKFWPPVYEKWDEQWPEHVKLWPDMPKDQKLTDEQMAILGQALKARQKVSEIFAYTQCPNATW